ncbi:hypothetical protein Cgig2_022472 [Carnegiea gigantea]|uniref:U-box domain-containing protein n=1 Tax=Carnegiea gigantea TaxID=171969 RepID=A0A9Q1QG78_9CARY|nr:hypothetical protein Cgig2_022472 [Carnegiea gigantea]
MDQVHEDEVPQYFLCPISLQIMKDPVTAATGITYDRDSIERWLKTAADPVCPVTKQRLARDSDLTPNHTLRRLIQAWCVANAKDRIPTPKGPLARTHVRKLLRGLTVYPASLDQLLALAAASDDQHKVVLAECGVPKAMVSLIITCYKEKSTVGLDQAMKILAAIWAPNSEIKAQVEQNFDALIDSITWILNGTTEAIRNLGILLSKHIVKVVSSSLVERLKPEFFKAVVRILTLSGGDATGMVPTKAALRVLLDVCQHGRNKFKIIEVNAIFELIELEWAQLGPAHPDKRKIIELGYYLLDQLCSCADGRARFLAHSGGIAILSKRILRVSPVVDDRVVHIFGLISKYSATKEVLQEMLAVGAVSKLCMILQADSAKYLKDNVYLLTRYPMLQF